MKKLIILCLLLVPLSIKAQWQTDYNRRGDEAKERKDYREAMSWYEQGVANCDRYSIIQLTEIWKVDESMRVSMRVVMNRSLRCLEGQAQENDSIAIKQLIEYYSEGIGPVKNELTANFWRERLEQLRRPPVTETFIPRTPKDRMKLFAGYHASLIAPFGIQVGGIGKSIGWYVRLHSNFTFQATSYDCEVVQNQLRIPQFDNDKDFYRATGRLKETNLNGSAGIMVKTIPNLYISAGVGYWDRKYAREFVMVNDGGADIQESLNWARDKKSSMNGVTIDMDGTYVIAGRIYGTLGGSLLNFKYIYPNAGVGIFF